MSYNNKNEQQKLRTNNAYNLPKDVSKLDLHGYTKSEGIRRTTEFLDRIASKSRQNNKGGEGSNKAWALIVTGSGSHSKTQGRKFY
jgi:DNA-nicking Smr family endonuclease